MYPKLISYKEIENTKRKFVLFGELLLKNSLPQLDLKNKIFS